MHLFTPYCRATTFVVSVVIAVVVLARKPVLDVKAGVGSSADRDQEAVQDKIPDVGQQLADPCLGTSVVVLPGQ